MSKDSEREGRRGRTCTGKVKQLDHQGNGCLVFSKYKEDVLLSPSSFSDPALIQTLQIGDRVRFSLMAVDVVASEPHCNNCGGVGYYPDECSRKINPRVLCHRCGKFDHCPKKCTFARLSSSSARCRHSSSPPSASASATDDADTKATSSVVSVNNVEDMRLFELSHDCFILDFDPSKIPQFNDCHGDDKEEKEVDEDEDEKSRVMRSIVCVKTPEQVKKVEEVEDCFILEFDPTQPLKFSNLSLSDKFQPRSADDEVSILAEKGQVACRDYPHPRHICGVFPFKTFPHEIHCKLCYCYICDSPAPCNEWMAGIVTRHCDATTDIAMYRELRKVMDKKKKVKG